MVIITVMVMVMDIINIMVLVIMITIINIFSSPLYPAQVPSGNSQLARETSNPLQFEIMMTMKMTTTMTIMTMMMTMMMMMAMTTLYGKHQTRCNLKS